MNAKKAWIWWIVFCLYFAGLFVAFAHGAQLEVTKLKVAWMGGSLVAMALGVFGAVKLNTSK